MPGKRVQIDDETWQALDLLARDGRVVGALLLNIRSGQFIVVRARATLIATGGGATMYKISSPSLEKSGDGMAMAWRAGADFVDMEMVQFHPTGVLAGVGTRLTGTIIEEGLRGAGGYLLNGAKERFMTNYDPRGERATRDIVSRGMFSEIRAGRGTARLDRDRREGVPHGAGDGARSPDRHQRATRSVPRPGGGDELAPAVRLLLRAPGRHADRRCDHSGRQHGVRRQRHAAAGAPAGASGGGVTRPPPVT